MTTRERPAPHPRTAGDAAACAEDSLRCLCGSLLARYVEGGVELKCRRCKRAVVIPISQPREGRSGAG